MSDHKAHCAFCFHQTDYGPGGDGLRMTLARVDGDPAQQALFAHVVCLAGRLHGRVPFDLGIFGDDWAVIDGSAPQTIYVELLAEAVGVWRPVEARPEGNNFRLPHRSPSGETWKFPPGALVRCTVRDLGSGPVLVATDAVS